MDHVPIEIQGCQQAETAMTDIIVLVQFLAVSLKLLYPRIVQHEIYGGLICVRSLQSILFCVLTFTSACLSHAGSYAEEETALRSPSTDGHSWNIKTFRASSCQAVDAISEILVHGSRESDG